MSDELERLRAIVEGAFEGRGDESWQLEDLGPKLLAVVEAARLSDNSCTAGTEDYASCE
ncbi:MAG: hypothetical protein GWO21_04250, partial [Gammaproteobacteria bacterium]|nr:hypothetical protein [Gammaproteobacteria bacterium]